MTQDPRSIGGGSPIPSEGYADQPFVVRTGDGAWLCTMTTGRGEEGAGGQHVVSRRSTDRGRTWESPVDVEPADGPEASYSVLLRTPYGRIYCFYNHNSDRVREVKREDGGIFARVDSLGHYVFKFSDDHGRSWSSERYDVPVREFACDRENVYGGALRFFWNVGRPLILGGEALLVLHKVGAMGAGFFAQSEGCFVRSDNLLSERDPARIRFETMPEGDIGLRAPAGGGRVAEEQSVVALSDGSLFCVYRTIDGSPACAYSRDNGRSWTPPEYLAYAPGGRPVKHPRAANFIWRCANGRFLYWFHNHGGVFIRGTSQWVPYEDRNPVWLTAAREVKAPDGLRLEFAQPEILLYDDDPYVRMSYPDLVEEEGRFWVTETQKLVGRVHELPPALVAGLFGQWDAAEAAREGLLLELPAAGGSMPAEAAMPRLPAFSKREPRGMCAAGLDLASGFTVEVALTLDSLAAGQRVLDSRAPDGRGICLRTTDRGTLALAFDDGRSECAWDTDPGALQAGRPHRVAFVVDGGPRIVTVLVDGVLCDGGEARQFGWGRFRAFLRDVSGGPALRLMPEARGRLAGVRLYGRALRTSEAVVNSRF